MKEAIQKAIEGGYGKGDVPYSTAQSGILIDPLFWQTLGKSLDWYEYQEITVELPRDREEARRKMIDVEDKLGVILRMNDERLVYSPYKKGKLSWKQQWHAFIDHLASGQDPESFFTSLLTNQQ